MSPTLGCGRDGPVLAPAPAACRSSNCAALSISTPALRMPRGKFGRGRCATKNSGRRNVVVEDRFHPIWRRPWGHWARRPVWAIDERWAIAWEEGRLPASPEPRAARWPRERGKRSPSAGPPSAGGRAIPGLTALLPAGEQQREQAGAPFAIGRHQEAGRGRGRARPKRAARHEEAVKRASRGRRPPAGAQLGRAANGAPVGHTPVARPPRRTPCSRGLVRKRRAGKSTSSPNPGTARCSRGDARVSGGTTTAAAVRRPRAHEEDRPRPPPPPGRRRRADQRGRSSESRGERARRKADHGPRARAGNGETHRPTPAREPNGSAAASARGGGAGRPARGREERHEGEANPRAPAKSRARPRSRVIGGRIRPPGRRHGAVRALSTDHGGRLVPPPGHRRAAAGDASGSVRAGAGRSIAGWSVVAHRGRRFCVWRGRLLIPSRRPTRAVARTISSASVSRRPRCGTKWSTPSPRPGRPVPEGVGRPFRRRRCDGNHRPLAGRGGGRTAEGGCAS